MSATVLILVCLATVVGVQSAEVKRHTVKDQLITKYTQQERLLQSIERIVVQKFAELKADRTISEKIVVDKLAELQGEVKSLSDKVAVSDRKMETLQNEMSRLVEFVNDFKVNQTRALCERTTYTPLMTTAASPQTTQMTLATTTTTKPCPSGYIGNAYGCYKVVWISSAPWSTADSNCRKDGAHLVSLESSGEVQALDALMKAAGAPSAQLHWIDAKRENGNWKWTHNNEPLTYENWSQGQPYGNGDCAHMYYASTQSSHLKWADVNCDWKYPYICEA